MSKNDIVVTITQNAKMSSEFDSISDPLKRLIAGYVGAVNKKSIPSCTDTDFLEYLMMFKIREDDIIPDGEIRLKWKARRARCISSDDYLTSMDDSFRDNLSELESRNIIEWLFNNFPSFESRYKEHLREIVGNMYCDYISTEKIETKASIIYVCKKLKWSSAEFETFIDPYPLYIPVKRDGEWLMNLYKKSCEE